MRTLGYIFVVSLMCAAQAQVQAQAAPGPSSDEMLVFVEICSKNSQCNLSGYTKKGSDKSVKFKLGPTSCDSVATTADGAFSFKKDPNKKYNLLIKPPCSQDFQSFDPLPPMGDGSGANAALCLPYFGKFCSK